MDIGFGVDLERTRISNALGDAALAEFQAILELMHSEGGLHTVLDVGCGCVTQLKIPSELR